MASVAKFVNDDELAKMLWQEHHKERDADAIATATRAPAGVGR